MKVKAISLPIFLFFQMSFGQNAISPANLSIITTQTCLGIEWEMDGDLNGNATCSAEYRKAGTAQWKQAMSLTRRAPKMPDLRDIYEEYHQMLITKYGMNYFAGSIFNLEAGTIYEIKLGLNDPDGGGTTETAACTTWDYPGIPTDGNVIEVSGGGSAFKNAAAQIKPGDVLLVHAGIYSGSIVVACNASVDSPVCVTTAGDGDVVIKGGGAVGVGISIGGKHVHVNGFKVQSFQRAVYFYGEHNALTNFEITDIWRDDGMYSGIKGSAKWSYIADNIVHGNYSGGNEGEGINVMGKGNVVCHNHISGWADAMSTGNGAASFDVHNNVFIDNGDDGCELDEGHVNIRVFNNRFSWTGCHCVSFQPYVALAYLVGNLLFDGGTGTMKERFNSSGLIAINNTFIARWFNATIQDFYARNNLFFSANDDAISPDGPVDLDYNGYSPNKHSSDAHGVVVSKSGTFAASIPPCVDRCLWIANGSTHPDLRLRSGSQAIDKGTVVPGIRESYNGSAPDLGALEYGAELPHWGPRPLDEQPQPKSTSIRTSKPKGVSATLGILPIPFGKGIRFLLPVSVRNNAFLSICDLQGKKLVTRSLKNMGSGKRSICWDGKIGEAYLSGGIYLAKIKMDNGVFCNKFVLLR